MGLRRSDVTRIRIVWNPLRHPACLLAVLTLLSGDSIAAGSLPELLDALSNKDHGIRLEAVSELASLKSKSVVEALAATAVHDRDPSVREEAVLALGGMESDDETVTMTLERALLDPIPLVRNAAIEAAVENGGSGAVRALAFALLDEEAALRRRAVYALGDIGGILAIGFLQPALSDKDGSVQQAAAEVLSDLEKLPDIP